MIQTILGSGGGIGVPLAKELKNYSTDIRLVSRNPKKVNDSDLLFPCDLMNFSGIQKAVEGSSVVYVTVGFEYKLKVWQSVWPAFMDAVIEGCVSFNAKLVFFDNVYSYASKAIPHMTEDAALDPPSEKGKVRLALLKKIMNATEKRGLQSLIARGADFYGPDNHNSALNMMVAENLLKGKKPQAFGNIDKVHTFTFTPDAARATALLGNTADAFNQTWHVPTTKEKITVRQWINLFVKETGIEKKIQTVPNWMIKLLGIFVPIMREFPEMMYQFEQDYVLDSSKFEKRFGWGATSPAEGVRLTVERMKKK